MTTNHAEVLSAFFDGELVDPDALTESLQQPGAIELLLEFSQLRREVHADASRPTEEFCEAMRDRLAREEGRSQLRRRFLRASLAASLMLAAAAGGFSVRTLLDRPEPASGREAAQMGPARPAQPQQVVRSPVIKSTSDQTAPVPPKPAVSDGLRLRFIQWKDSVL